MAGDPKPTVAWHRENGVLPQDRSRILLDNTLRIEDARPEDQGKYICNGHNEGGNVTAAVKLYVYGKCVGVCMCPCLCSFVLFCFFFGNVQ